MTRQRVRPEMNIKTVEEHPNGLNGKEVEGEGEEKTEEKGCCDKFAECIVETGKVSKDFLS